jgi:hypothetical protein
MGNCQGQWRSQTRVSPSGSGPVNAHSGRTGALHALFPTAARRQFSSGAARPPAGHAPFWPRCRGAMRIAGGLSRPQEEAELMPQNEVLGGHRGPRAKEGDEGRQKGSSQAEYAERIRAENESEGPARGAQEALSAEAPMPPDDVWNSGEAHAHHRVPDDRVSMAPSHE